MSLDHEFRTFTPQSTELDAARRVVKTSVRILPGFSSDHSITTLLADGTAVQEDLNSLSTRELSLEGSPKWVERMFGGG